MAEENILEEAPETQEKRKGTNFKERISRYKIPAIVIIVALIAIYVTSSINGSINGAIISKLESENQNLKSSISSDQEVTSATKTSLALQVKDLEGQISDLERDIGFYKSLVSGLDTENKKSISTPYGFEITWDEYVTTKPGSDLDWFVLIKSTDTQRKTYSLDLKIKSNVDEVFSKKPPSGSLSLEPGSFGTLNTDFSPEKKGYAILGIYVNNKYVGDVVIFSL